jgi:NDP-sugar pyrophosphorylase family protein
VSSIILRERAFILAGGLGTRLSGLIPECPKVLAPIAGRPFLDILIQQLWDRGVRRFVLLLGHRAEQVLDFVAARRKAWPADLDIASSVEPRRLGTAGAVKLAQRYCDGRFLLLNGDTYFDLDVAALLRTHAERAASVTLAAATVSDADRYGRLDVSSTGLVEAFREKDVSAGAGLINAGIYLMEPELFEQIAPDTEVSLERDVFPRLVRAGSPIAVSAQQGAFFDIGTPESYASFVSFCQRLAPPHATTEDHRV